MADMEKRHSKNKKSIIGDERKMRREALGWMF
jgi:hypothetical protein